MTAPVRLYLPDGQLPLPRPLPDVNRRVTAENLPSNPGPDPGRCTAVDWPGGLADDGVSVPAWADAWEITLN
ncbi:MAG: hypothetical protein ACRDQZ_17255, partial [Mycobacteriales bacterium]